MKPFALWACLTLALCLSPITSAAVNQETSKKFRIIYVEGGPFSNFQRIFQGLCVKLQHLKLVQNGDVPIPRHTASLEPMWQWMVEHARGQHIEFLADGFYSANYDEKKLYEMFNAIQQRIAEQNDVDAILVFGTWAGKYVSKLDLSVPVIVSSVTDPILAGIVPSEDDSGKDNLVAVVNKDRYARHVELFANIFGFHTLGIAYEDTETGRNSIALPQIEKAASHMGIKIVRCTDMFDIGNEDLAAESLTACHRDLVRKGADAVYVTYNMGISDKSMPAILAPLLDAKIPTFSQRGGDEVDQGVLLGLAQSNDLAEGAYSAQLLSRIMAGEPARRLPQLYIEPINLQFNQETAKRIGWKPTLEVLMAVDDIY